MATTTVCLLDHYGHIRTTRGDEIIAWQQFVLSADFDVVQLLHYIILNHSYASRNPCNRQLFGNVNFWIILNRRSLLFIIVPSGIISS